MVDGSFIFRDNLVVTAIVPTHIT